MIDCGRRMWRCVVVSLALLAMDSQAEEEIKGVDLALVPSVETIAPASGFTVGLVIHHHEGFHTYWSNPGAVGYPTKISWELPEGFTAGEIRWAVPEMSSMAGHPVFGYERDATLLVDITGPAELSGEEMTFHAKVSWMACADECRPGNKRFSFTLPVAAETVPDASVKELFAEAEVNIPKPLEGWTAVLESAADAEKIVFLLTPPEGLADPGTLRVYSSDGQISSDPDPQITRMEGGGYRIEVERAEFSPKGASSLPVVLVAEKELGADGVKFGALEPSYRE
ncbi:MAG: protein-disulfide reductase DsbD domain-containing protein [Luteolibacter sp.]